MRGELIHLVETERRGNAATGRLVFVVGSLLGLAAGGMWPIAGWTVFAILAVIVVRLIAKDRAYRRLLDSSTEIAQVERVTSLRRPALRVRFRGGGGLTLPTWNYDREQVVAQLERRELPPARLLR